MSRNHRPKPDYLVARSQNRYTDYRVNASAELLTFLIEKVTNGSRQKAKTLLTNRCILIEKNIVTQYNFALMPGMIVQVSNQKNNHEFRHPQLQILYEDAYLIVVKKKEGLLAVATETQRERTAQHILTDYIRRSNPRGRMYVVHRLDRATSGIMMFAKDEKTQNTLRDNWHQFVYDRRYVAVVEGEMEKDQGMVKSYLSDHGLHVVSSQVDNGEGKLSITHFRTIRRGNGYSLVELQLETGRKNQIRVHMRDIGHLIAGDRRYGAQTDPLGRMCLHAFKLCFIHPVTRERMQFEEEYPSRFKGLT
ncbi:MAG: RluA family pseudouridine synthase, partial [Bacteroidaceae bacterium]|nr:RluA family pseudouridine synthase [Bacteroidaceae bacterium]